MKNKIFNIGEYAIGGRVKVTISDFTITIKCLDWDTRETVLTAEFSISDKNHIGLWLECEVTTAYYSDKIMKWINDNVNTNINRMQY